MRSVAALAFLFIVVGAAPQKQEYEIIPILRSNHVAEEDGSYSFDFEGADGTKREETGTVDGTKSGSWSFTLPDGTPARFSFVADEGGYRVQSDLIPALPDFVLEQIAKAERERAAGNEHDGQWDPVLYA